MRKKSFRISFMIIVLLFTLSCNNTATYIDRLNDEKKAIKAFISENNITVLKEYPSDSVFAPNEFYLDPTTGVYYNVIDKGSYKPNLGDEIYIRYKDVRYISGDDTTVYDGNYFSLYGPVELIYGNLNTYQSTGWVAPIPNVGHEAKVKMIVPFNSGTTYDQSYYYTVYYGLMEYRIGQN